MLNRRLGVPHPRTRHLLAPLSLVMLASCGGSSGSSADPTAPTAPTAPTDGTVVESGQSAPNAPTMTGVEICRQLTVESVASALDLAVTAAVADDSATPQCAYEYTNDTGGTSNLTVASMRPADVGGLTGSEAYDVTVDVNRAFAPNDEQAVDAGDEAVRLSGSALHAGILRIGDQVYTVIVPTVDAEPAAIETLLATMATSFG
jgi:hypothetical protein